MKIYYWDGIIDPDDLLRDVDAKLIAQLGNGEYQSADLDTKKLPGYRIYSIRLNYSDRLLFTTVMIKGKSCLLMLERINNHDYQKSRFLKSSVLANYLEKNSEALQQMVIDQASFQAAEFPPLDAQPPSKPSQSNYHPLEYYQQTFIELSEHQHQARTLALPLIVSGAAGSGKSCVAISRLREFISQHPEKACDGVLYITQSKALVKTMKALWQQLPVAQDAVLFLTYEQLLIKLSKEVEDKQFVDASDFFKWLDKYNLIYKKLVKTGRVIAVNESFLKQTDRIYQEMRILSAYDQATYLALGKHQSLFHDVSERQWIWDAYQSYLHYLDSNNYINPSFYTFESKKRLGFVVVDEAQDFSYLQLLLLFKLAFMNAICFCIDTHQSLGDDLSKRPFLLSLGGPSQPVNYYELPKTHRCPLYITKMANEVLHIKRRLVGGTGDKLEQLELQLYEQDDKSGEVQWLEALQEENISDLIHQAKSSQFAVITLPEYLDEAKRLLKTPLVFSVAEVKGLEFLDIFCYRLLDQPAYQYANNKFKGLGVEKKASRHRPKAEQGEEQFSVLMNTLFTAFTRAKNKLIIYQQKNRAILELVTQLQKALPLENKHAMKEETIEPAHCSLEDWLQSAEKLWQLDKKQQAMSILTEKLSYSRADAIAFFNQFAAPEPLNPLAAQGDKLTSISDVETKTIKKNKVDKTIKAKPARQPIPEKPQSVESQGSDRKSEAYIGQLLKNFSESNLISCLKHKKADAFFYGINYEGKKLISHILRSDKHLKILLNVIDGALKSDTKTVSLFNSEHLMRIDSATNRPFMVEFFTSYTRFHFLSCCLHLNLEEGQSFPPEYKEQMLDLFMHGKKFEISKLNVILEMGLNSLLTVLECFPDLAEAFTPEILLTIINVPLKVLLNGLDDDRGLSKRINNAPDISVRFLSWLAGDEVGRNILEIILDKNPELATQLPLDAWTNPGIANAYGLNTLPLHWLSSTSKGVSIIKKLFKLNPHFAAEIPAHPWTLKLSNPIQKPLSALYYLTTTAEGIAVLNNLLHQNAALATDIPIDVWMGRDHPFSDNPEYIPLCQLAFNFPGHDVLIKLCTLNPQIIDNIPLGLWQTMFACNKGLTYLFLIHPSGQAVVETIIKRNPEVIDLLISNILSQGVQDNATALFWLSKTKEGVQVLERMINYLIEHKKNQYYHFINALFFTLPYTGKVKPYENAFPLFLLCLSLPGIALLTTIFEHSPSLISEIPGEYWLRRLPHFDNTFCLHQLLTSGEIGQPLLQKIIQQHPDVAQDITGEHLFYFFLRPLKIKAFFLELLIRYTNCQEILIVLFEKNPDLFYSVSSRQWRELLKNPIKDDELFIDGICQTDNSHNIIYYLLSRIPLFKNSFANILSDDSLTVGGDTNKKRSLSLLKETETGSKILSLLSTGEIVHAGFFSRRQEIADAPLNPEGAAYFKHQ